MIARLSYSEPCPNRSTGGYGAGSFTCPVFALLLVSFAPNNVVGFALVTLLNAISMLPIAAYFVGLNWQWVAGIFPSYWTLMAFWLAAQRQAYGSYFIIGPVINLIALWLLLQRFKMIVHR